MSIVLYSIGWIVYIVFYSMYCDSIYMLYVFSKPIDMLLCNLLLQVEYTLVTDTPYFRIDSATGMVIVHDHLDRETKDRHVLEVKATDKPGNELKSDMWM